LKAVFAAMSNALTWALLLQLFHDIPDERLVRPLGNDVIAIIKQLPADASTYEELAGDAFEALILRPDESDDVAFQRLETILRALLYHDGRTLRAHLKIAQLAYENPGYSEHGINSLAAIANYLRKRRAIDVDAASLSRVLAQYENDEELSHNAAECRRLLRRVYGVSEPEQP
jgi:hypothetical protein